MDIRIAETSDQIDAMEVDLPINVTITHVKGHSVRALWAKRIELADLIAGEDVTVETSDGVIYIGTVDDVEDSTRGKGALISLR